MSGPVGVFGAVKGLFEYNRENFFFDRTLNQLRVYQIQKMRVAQVKLYRDDLRQLFDLTISKMDMYLLFDILLLLFEGGLFYDGRLPHGTPAWLFWLWAMSLGSAMFFLCLSIFFAIHASIAAQTFQVRLLTQWLRLPIPSAEDIHAAAGSATEFEETRAKDMLRVPGLDMQDPFHCVEKFPDVPNDLLKSDLVEDYDMFVEHFYLFRDLQKHWQGFDAYCRIGMVIGMNQLLSALSYTSMAYFLLSFKIIGGVLFPLVLTVLQIVHMKMNIQSTTRAEQIGISVMIVGPILLSVIAGVQSAITDNTAYGDYLSPVIFFLSGAWIVFLTLLGSEDDGGLPCRFVTVSSIDVLGLDSDDTKFSSAVTENDMPVAVAVPAAAVIARGEEKRRRREPSATSQESSLNTLNRSDISAQGLVQGGGIAVDVVLASDVLKSSYYSERPLQSREDAANEFKASDVLQSYYSEPAAAAAAATSGVPDMTPSETDEMNGESEIRAYKHSSKTKMIPWKSFREAGAVLTCLWIFAVTYSILASFHPRWGWPRTMPSGGGEEAGGTVPVAVMHATHSQRLLPDHQPLKIREQVGPFTIIYDEGVDFGKLNAFNSTSHLVSSIDVIGLENFVVEDRMVRVEMKGGNVWNIEVSSNGSFVFADGSTVTTEKSHS